MEGETISAASVPIMLVFSLLIHMFMQSLHLENILLSVGVSVLMAWIANMWILNEMKTSLSDSYP